MADQEVKKEIWKQQQLLDYLQEGLELGVENAGHAEIQEAYLKLADLYNRDGDLHQARESMKKANEHGDIIEQQVSESRKDRTKSFEDALNKSRPTTGGSRPVSRKDAEGEGESKSPTNSTKEEEASMIAKNEVTKLISSLAEKRREPRDASHTNVISECTRMQEKVNSILDKHLEDSSQLAQAHLSVKNESKNSDGGNGGAVKRKFRFWYEDVLHQTERMLHSCKVQCKEILARQVDREKEEWMASAQQAIDVKQEQEEELVALVLVDELVGAFKHGEEDRAAWQLQSNQEVARVCEAILQSWKEKAARQKDEENDVLRQRHRAEAIARQRAVLASARQSTSSSLSPDGSPAPGDAVSGEGPGGGTLAHDINSGVDFHRLQAAFSQAIPATAVVNSVEVEKLQEQISKWRDNAKAQIERDSELQMKAWTDRIGKQETAQQKIDAIKGIQRERREAKSKLVESAHNMGILLPPEAVHDPEEEDEEEEDFIEGPGAGLEQGSVVSGISMLTADTAVREGPGPGPGGAVTAPSMRPSSKGKGTGTGTGGGAVSRSRPDSRDRERGSGSPNRNIAGADSGMKSGKGQAAQGNEKKQRQKQKQQKGAGAGTSVRAGIRDEASRNYKKMESKFGFSSSSGEDGPPGTGTHAASDADTELLTLQLQRQRELDKLVREQKRHWEGVVREEKLAQMALEKKEAEERRDRERREKEERERLAREEEERRAIEIEKEWTRLQAQAGEEKREKEASLKAKAERAEVSLGVKHSHAKAVKKTVRARERDSKLAAAKGRIEERQRKEYARLFPKRHDEISQAAVKKEQEEQRRVRREREKFHMVGMTFSSKDKEDAYLELMRRTTDSTNVSVLAPKHRNDVGEVNSMLERVNSKHSNEGPTPYNAYGLVSVAPAEGGLEGGRNVGGASFIGVQGGISPEHSVSSHQLQRQKPGGGKLDNMLLLSPTKESKGRYELTSHLDTKVDRHHRYSRKGRPVSITNTPNKHPEVMQVLESREGGELLQRIEAAKVARIEHLDKVYTEEQPKLILGQRHDGDSRPGTKGSSRGSSPRRSPRKTLSRGGSRPGTSTSVASEGEDEWESSMIGSLTGSPWAGGLGLVGVGERASTASGTGSRPGSTTSTQGDGRPDVEYNKSAPGSSRLHTRPGKYMLESRLPEAKGPASPNADLYGSGELSPIAYPHITAHHDKHEQYRTSFDEDEEGSINYDMNAHGDTSLEAASATRRAEQARLSHSDQYGDGHTGSSALHVSDNEATVENQHYRDIDGWPGEGVQRVQVGSSLEQNSVSSFSGAGEDAEREMGMGTGMQLVPRSHSYSGELELSASGSVGSIGPLPAYANRDVVYNLKINKSTHNVRERQPAKHYRYPCSIGDCTKCFAQSWLLWNHQYQEHGADIRGSDFALTRNIKIHPHQLIDRKKKLRKSGTGANESQALVTLSRVSSTDSGGDLRKTVRQQRQENNDVYASKNVSVSSSVVPGGLPPIAASLPGGSYITATHQRHDMGGHINPDSVTYGGNNNSHFDERTMDTNLGHPRPSEGATGGSGGGADGGKKRYDDVVFIQARKWEEGQRLAELRVHTQKLREWRRSVEVQLQREARALPKGKWNRRTKEKYIPGSSKQEMM